MRRSRSLDPEDDEHLPLLGNNSSGLASRRTRGRGLRLQEVRCATEDLKVRRLLTR